MALGKRELSKISIDKDSLGKTLLSKMMMSHDQFKRAVVFLFMGFHGIKVNKFLSICGM
ncbi:hypothetical protein YN1HA_5260 [Sulfurisphaera ohwakuensis]